MTGSSVVPVAVPVTRPRSHVEPRCPVRVGEPCTLCVPGATGPRDCGLVYLVMDDDELRAALTENRRGRRARRAEPPDAAPSPHGAPLTGSGARPAG